MISKQQDIFEEKLFNSEVEIINLLKDFTVENDVAIMRLSGGNLNIIKDRVYHAEKVHTENEQDVFVTHREQKADDLGFKDEVFILQRKDLKCAYCFTNDSKILIVSIKERVFPLAGASVPLVSECL